MLVEILVYFSLVLVALAVAGLYYPTYKKEYRGLTYTREQVYDAVRYVFYVSYLLFLLTNVYLGVITFWMGEITVLYSILMQFGFMFEVLTMFTTGFMVKEEWRAMLVAGSSFVIAVFLDPLLYRVVWNVDMSYVKSFFINLSSVSAFLLGYLPAKYLDESLQYVKNMRK